MPFGGLPSMWSSRGRILRVAEPQDPVARGRRELEVVVSGERGGASLTFLVAPEMANDLIRAHEHDQPVEIRIVRAPASKKGGLR